MTASRRDDDTFRLADFMCFAVYSANLAYSRVYKPVLEELGLTYPQYVTVVALWDEEQLTVKGLSDKLFLEPSTVTPMLKRLEAMGYVTRTRSGEDERVVHVRLTEAGRKLRDKARELAKVTYEATGLNPDEFRILQRGITNLRSNLMEAAGEA
ncbi:MarR family winged helix-turn-helix transcriptional regulator [Devosia sp. A16]|uniref:MarR family winged helix-turn-helix transcriptional regulator n=1 Tax=Devosia sp. A16 TaxID=1736675 RepID=UPI0006D7DE08|nr:MarR family transcriptional regulator [Devosia sp. A16]